MTNSVSTSATRHKLIRGLGWVAALASCGVGILLLTGAALLGGLR